MACKFRKLEKSRFDSSVRALRTVEHTETLRAAEFGKASMIDEVAFGLNIEEEMSFDHCNSKLTMQRCCQKPQAHHPGTEDAIMKGHVNPISSFKLIGESVLLAFCGGILS
jgi:hypothetical protein